MQAINALRVPTVDGRNPFRTTQETTRNHWESSFQGFLGGAKRISSMRSMGSLATADDGNLGNRFSAPDPDLSIGFLLGLVIPLCHVIRARIARTFRPEQKWVCLSPGYFFKMVVFLLVSLKTSPEWVPKQSNKPTLANAYTERTLSPILSARSAQRRQEKYLLCVCVCDLFSSWYQLVFSVSFFFLIRETQKESALLGCRPHFISPPLGRNSRHKLT